MDAFDAFIQVFQDNLKLEEEGREGNLMDEVTAWDRCKLELGKEEAVRRWWAWVKQEGLQLDCDPDGN